MARLTKQEMADYERLERDFMSPELAYINRRCKRDLEDMFPDGEGPQGHDAYAGWYSRLSAPGFLDCTDWNGPFKSATAAKRYLVDLYGYDD